MITFNEQDHYFMQQALLLARQAAAAGEVPVGAVVVSGEQIIGSGFNQPISTHDPAAHAEMVALRAAAQRIQNYRLVGATMYVTLEPCMMCAGAMVHARIKRLVYGAPDPKTGVIMSQARLLDQFFLNHKVSYEGGLLSDECGGVLKDFFQQRRWRDIGLRHVKCTDQSRARQQTVISGWFLAQKSSPINRQAQIKTTTLPRMANFL